MNPGLTEIEFSRSGSAPGPSPALRDALAAFARGAGPAALLVRGVPLGAAGCVPTPHRDDRAPTALEAELERTMLAIAEPVGSPAVWTTQQRQRLVHDIVPTPGHRWHDLSCGSNHALSWHSEEAYDPHPPDVVILACIRNPSRVATTWWAGLGQLSEDMRAALAETQFVVRPDQYQRARTHSVAERRVAVIESSATGLRLRADRVFMRGASSPGREAWTELVARIDGSLDRLVLEPTDCLLLDNRRAVHGREAFTARFDGGDRWLKRVLVRATQRSTARTDCAGATT